MKEFFLEFVDKALTSSNPSIILVLIAFAESSFFPIPPDTLMIPLSFLKPELAFFYALLTTVSSVLGGVFGYFIGAKGGRHLVRKFISDDKLYQVKLLYQKYDVWAVIVAGFTPIPYKIFTLAAGLFELDIKRFIIASIIGRGGRFFLVGGLIFIFGERIKVFLRDYLELTIVLITIMLIGGFVIVDRIIKKQKSVLSK
ncbi:MAG: DedA family protein [Patescibacteria group bacterium]|nr:DedA family protein [Patescibacteria group bacterium]